MTPEERSLIDGLFDRIKSAAGQPRDADAEALIARRVQEAPYAPYALAQTVLVQDHALQQALARIQELEEQARRTAEPQPQPTSFLGGLFGGGARGTSVPTTGNRAMPLPQQGSGYTSPGYGAPAGGYSSPGYGQQPNAPYPQQAAGPWGGQPRGGFGGGGFLQGALTTAAGVAGGALLFQGINHLMSGGSGPIADQASSLLGGNALPTSGDLGQMADNALGGNAGDGGWNAGGNDGWNAGTQDASADSGFNNDAPVQDASFDDGGGWDAGGGDDSSWT